MLKKLIINLLKISLAVGLIYWLVESGRLDFSLLNQLIKTPSVIIISLGIFQIINLLATLRLRIFISQRVKEGISTLRLFFANWIGLFFNSVLPGSVSGDLVKIFYIQRLNKKLTKKFLLLTVLTDRIIGLSGLILVGGVVSLFNYQTLASLSEDVKTLVQLNILFSVFILIGFSMLYLAPNFPLIISNKFKRIKPFKNILTKLEGIWIEFTEFKHKLILLLSISILVQSMAVIAFWTITSPFADGDFSLLKAFSIMPMGFISIALPIAPAGLGVGHVVFQKLLSFFSINNGASLFNLFFFVFVGSNLTGVIPYVLSDVKKSDIEEKI